MVLSNFRAVELLGNMDVQEFGSFEDNFYPLSIGYTFAKSDDRVLLLKQDGIEIYDSSGTNSELVLSKDFDFLMYGGIEGNLMNIVVENQEQHGLDKYTIYIYDISNLTSIQLLGEISSSLTKSYIIGNYLMVSGFYYIGEIEHPKISIYELNNFELVNTYYNYYLANKAFNFDKLIYVDETNYSYHIAEIIEDGEFVNSQVIPNCTGGNFQVVDSSLISYTSNTIQFYNMSDEINYLGSVSLNLHEYEQLQYQGLYYNGQIIATLTSSNQLPIIQYISVYDITDLEDVVLLQNYQVSELDSYSNQVCTDIISLPNCFLLSSVGFGILKFNISSTVLEDSVIKYSEVRTRMETSYVYGSIFYDNYVRNVGFNQAFNIEDLNNIELVQNPDSLGNSYFFGDENEYKVIKNFEMHTLELFQREEGGCYSLNQSYNVVNDITLFRYITIIDWDGENLLYNLGSKAYWIKYENNLSVLVWQDIDSQEDVYWYKNDDYLYKVSETAGITVFQIEEEGLSFLSNINCGNSTNSLKNVYLNDNILTILHLYDVNRFYDLQADPEYLSVELDIEIAVLNSKVKRFQNYYFYTGVSLRNSNLTNSFHHRYCYLNIEQKVDGVFIQSAKVQCHAPVSDFHIINNVTNSGFNIIVQTTAGYKVFACEITPNGNLEIEPVTVNLENYPNPFNPETTISYNLKKDGDVELDIYNIKGQKVKSLMKEYQKEGNHKVVWNGENESGKRVSSGVYFCKIKTKDEVITRKMTLMK